MTYADGALQLLTQQCAKNTDRVSGKARKQVGVVRNSGFTIIEVMIFLAISAAMFISVIVIFGGVQTRNQFIHSMRDIDSKFQDVINDVSTGYFDELKSYQCNAGSGTPPSFSPGGSGQGTSQGCIFLGKIIHLTPGGRADVIEISPVVGNRLNGSNRDVSTFAEARPTTVFSPVDLTTSYDIRWGTRIKRTTPPTPSYATGFYGSLASYSGGGTLKDSGAQRVLQYSHAVLADQTRSNLNGCISNASFCSGTPMTTPWVICFERADGGETAQISIGGSGTLTTKLEFINC